MSISGAPEAIYEAEDEPTPRERELEAYHAAVKGLDPDEVLHSACAVLPYQQSAALVDLVREQLTMPYEDISHANIHPDTAQRVTRAVLEAIAVSIDGMANMHLYAD
jgi:hypothetical protein